MAKKSILDDDCDRPACNDMMAKMKAASAAAAAAPTTSEPQTPDDNHCPLNSEQLGRSSWGLLHSMAAWYPETPSTSDQRHMKGFMEALARFYPCSWCAQDFQTSLETHPVQTHSRTAICQWLCEQHNAVNTKLGKPTFPCDMPSLDARWRKNPQCQGEKHPRRSSVSIDSTTTTK